MLGRSRRHRCSCVAAARHCPAPPHFADSSARKSFNGGNRWNRCAPVTWSSVSLFVASFGNINGSAVFHLNSVLEPQNLGSMPERAICLRRSRAGSAPPPSHCRLHGVARDGRLPTTHHNGDRPLRHRTLLGKMPSRDGDVCTKGEEKGTLNSTKRSTASRLAADL